MADTTNGSPDEGEPLHETDYTIGQDNIRPFGLDIHNPVFVISGLSIIAFVLITLMFQKDATEFFGWLRPALTSNFDWFFLAAGNVFVVFCVILMLTPLGSIRLGGATATPDYGYIGWFAMLFAAGMGIGLMFFGVSEPMSHYASSLGGTALENGARTDWAPLGAAAGNTDAARDLAMAATIFHWGLHPWAIYAVVGLSLAFFAYNKGLPLTIRSAFYPLIKDKSWGWFGHVIDVVAVLATIFGLATSLGFGAQQAAGGLHFLFGVPNTVNTRIAIIVGVTAVALVSVVRR